MYMCIILTSDGSVVKNPAVWEMWVQSLGQEDALQEKMATHSSILAWKNPMDIEAWKAIVHGYSKVGHDLVTKQHSTVVSLAGYFHIVPQPTKTSGVSVVLWNHVFIGIVIIIVMNICDLTQWI